MHLDDRAVQGHRLQLEGDDLLALESGKDAVEHAGFAPAVHARVDRVPVAKALWQSAPLASLFGDIEDRVDDLKVVQADIAALSRQAVGNALILLQGDFHRPTLP